MNQRPIGSNCTTASDCSASGTPSWYRRLCVLSVLQHTSTARLMVGQLRCELVESGHCCQYARKMEAPSILRSLVGLLLALATVACGSATSKKPMTVEELIAQIDQLDGQTVMVTGYLGECEALSCMLYRNKAESDDVDRAMSAIRAALAKGATDVSSFPFPDHPSVSIGPGSQSSFFDLRAKFFANGYVVITGEATNQCRSKNTFCFDRVGDLQPTSIRSASAPS